MYFYIMLFPNKKVYIGITNNIIKRKIIHKSRSKHRRYGNEYLYNAIEKYGWDNIEWQISDGYESWSELCSLEIQKIAEYDSTNRNNGYNISSGGDGYCGFHHTEEWKEMMSKKMSGINSPSYGRKLTDEQKEHLSKINSGENNPRFGKHKTEKQKNAMSNGFEKYCEKNGHPWNGKHHSEESKQKISKANRGCGNGMYGKCGEKSSNHKLNDIQVDEIRHKYKTRLYTLLKLAIEYKVSQSQIFNIVKNKQRKVKENL